MPPLLKVFKFWTSLRKVARIGKVARLGKVALRNICLIFPLSLVTEHRRIRSKPHGLGEEVLIPRYTKATLTNWPTTIEGNGSSDTKLRLTCDTAEWEDCRDTFDGERVFFAVTRTSSKSIALSRSHSFSTIEPLEIKDWTSNFFWLSSSNVPRVSCLPSCKNNKTRFNNNN